MRQLNSFIRRDREKRSSDAAADRELDARTKSKPRNEPLRGKPKSKTKRTVLDLQKMRGNGAISDREAKTAAEAMDYGIENAKRDE